MSNLPFKLIIISFLFSLNAYSQAGIIDSTFGINGVSQTPLSSTGLATSRNVIALSDGKYIVTGQVYVGSVSELCITRFNHNGTLDTQFGTNGKTTTAIPGGILNYSFCSVMQPDGKIVLGGHTYDGSGTQFVVARYDSTGNPDTQFGTGGFTIAGIGGTTFGDYAQGIALQSNGRIILAGTSYNGANTDFTMVAFDPNGIVDSSFGTNGSVITAIGSENDNCYSIAVQNDDKILLAGDIQNGNNYTFTCARYNENGSLDNSFSTNGIGQYPVGINDDDYGYSIKVQNDKKIVFGGTAYNGFDYDFVIVRIDSNGVLDNGFGSNGIAMRDFGTGNDDWGRAIEIQSGGKILVAGKTSIIGSSFGVTRFNEDGTNDATFGTNGISYIQVASAQHNIYGMTLDLNSDIVICGSAPASTPDNFFLVRYHSGLNTGIEDLTVNSDWSVYPNPNNGNFTVQANNKFDELEIIDISGKIIYKTISTDNNLFSVSINLESGMYFLRLKKGNEIVSAPLIIY
ncbi:MAG: T9SS type A sorting domain-containing protein [Bacteroidia bacterium]|nr:T9SS type A sorting domain-containing protein [Bacteroidia bacterium]